MTLGGVEPVVVGFRSFLRWSVGICKKVIEGGILHVLEKDGEILGTGEFRERKNWVPFADVGMIVNKKYRRVD